MKDRRNYSRLKVNIPISVFLTDGTEVNGYINDISEKGINISLSKGNTLFVIRERDNITLQFVDRLGYEIPDKNEVIVISAHVLRIDMDGNNVRLGCMVQDNAYEQYVTRKKVDNFVGQSLENTQSKNAH